MAKFIITSGKKLAGFVVISGAKNAALKMLAATILSKYPCKISNVPNISDIRVMLDILKSIGAKVKFSNGIVDIDPSDIDSYCPDPNLVKQMRASIVLAGPLLARFGKAKIAKPGGCVIGARPVYIHWRALEKMGVKVTETKQFTILETKNLHGKIVVLDEMSVTATENLLMLATLTPGKTIIRLAAAEPEIADLADMLNLMGAKISGAGTHDIKVVGVKKLAKLNNYTVLPDRIEAGTFAILGAINGNITIKNIIPHHLDMFLNKLEQAGAKFKLKYHNRQAADLIFSKPGRLHPIKINTRTYPGYPTDLQAPLAVLLTQCPRTSKIFETMYDNRLKYLQELKKMNGKINVLDSHTAEISGPTKLKGAKITSYDLRAGATLLLAALIASGTTEIDNIETIDRGYENIEQKLRNLGANIKRIK